MGNSLSAPQLKSMFLHVAERIIAAKDMLCEADRNIGDGDHGIGMAKGFEGVKVVLTENEFDDAYAVFSRVGRTMIRVMGGASGIIFGLLFYAGSKDMTPKTDLSTEEFAEIFSKALAEIKKKGGADLGDKTMVDALSPAVDAMKMSAAAGDDFHIFFSKAAASAEEGKEASKNYIARFGKAKTLGERAIGFPDAGCVTLTELFNAMKDWAEINLSA